MLDLAAGVTRTSRLSCQITLLDPELDGLEAKSRRKAGTCSASEPLIRRPKELQPSLPEADQPSLATACRLPRIRRLIA